MVVAQADSHAESGNSTELRWMPIDSLLVAVEEPPKEEAFETKESSLSEDELG